MRKALFILTLIPTLAQGAEMVKSPLYKHLLEQARARLDERHEKIQAISSPEGLLARGEEVREAMVLSVGGLPDRTTLNPRTLWTKDFGDYRVEGVIFESRPNFPVTANLYLPNKGTPPFPAVLGPCGHGLDAKAHDTYQTCWINLARRGFAVLSFDPIGQGERLSYLKEDKSPLFWGTTEHTQLGVMALLLGKSFAREMIWDGMRAIDYLETRPEIDRTRIGCTGNSGGGTQTAYLMALDKRIQCAAVSCYITSLKRLFETIGPQDAEQNLIGQVAAGFDQADFVEACLPRPVLLCCATKDFFDIQGTWETFREAKGFFGRFGMPERVDIIESPGEHGYHQPQRTAMYHWMARWLKREFDETPEPETPLLPAKELNCTESGQVLTSVPGARTMASIYAEEAAELREIRQSRGVEERARSAVWVAKVERPKELKWTESGGVVHDTLVETTLTAEIEPGWELQARLLEPEAGATSDPVLWLADLARAEGDESPETEARAGHPVLVVSPRGLDQGDRYKGGELDKFFGDWVVSFLALHLNRPLLAQRTEDVLAALDLLKARFPGKAIEVNAFRETTPAALMATTLEPTVAKLVLTEGLISWDSVFEAPYTLGVLSNVAPGMLLAADIPDLARSILPRKVVLRSALKVTGDRATEEEVRSLYGPEVEVIP
ncbi:MAG: acetylxylan esterase [Candidatus Omnitrophica bacterium]|nr:hypothetical protein [bacterium]NUN95625.1 acetylxylan esterase [Candidatus Omnitrophota bacterium]